MITKRAQCPECKKWIMIITPDGEFTLTSSFITTVEIENDGN